MTKIILFFGTLLIIVNSIIGLLISNYLPFNWLAVDIVLVINIILLYKISISKMNNGFKISLSFIFPILGLTSIILAILSPNKYEDNYYLISFILILLLEVSFYLISINLKSINLK